MKTVLVFLYAATVGIGLIIAGNLGLDIWTQTMIGLAMFVSLAIYLTRNPIS